MCVICELTQTLVKWWGSSNEVWQTCLWENSMMWFLECFFGLDLIFEGVGYDKLFVFNFALYLFFFNFVCKLFFFLNKIILFFQTM